MQELLSVIDGYFQKARKQNPRWRNLEFKFYLNGAYYEPDQFYRLVRVNLKAVDSWTQF